MKIPQFVWFTIDSFFPNLTLKRAKIIDFNVLFVPLSHLMKIRQKGKYCSLVQWHTLIDSCARLELHSSIFFQLKTPFVKFNNDFFLDQTGTVLDFDCIPSNCSFSCPLVSHGTDLYHCCEVTFFWTCFFHQKNVIGFF